MAWCHLARKHCLNQCWPSSWCHITSLGVVSLTFCELSQIISWKYTMPEIIFMVRISSWNFVRTPKAWLWAHVQSFSMKFSSEVRFMQYTNFERIFWRARETFVKQSQEANGLTLWWQWNSLPPSTASSKHWSFPGGWVYIRAAVQLSQEAPITNTSFHQAQQWQKTRYKSEFELTKD